MNGLTTFYNNQYQTPQMFNQQLPITSPMVSYTAPIQPVPATYTAPIQPVPATYTAPIQPIPATYSTPIQPIPATYSTPIQPVPATYTAPIQTVPATYTAPIQPIPAKYTAPIQPGPALTPQMIAPIYPYTGARVTNAIPTPVGNNFYRNNVKNRAFDARTESASTEGAKDGNTINDTQVEESNKTDDEKSASPAEQYIKLPKADFPTARMLSVDPNSMIDEFCKLENVNEHVPWILDLEFGVPRAPVTRAIATYDVKYNSVNCKNTPGAIHPGFEKCNSGFKREMLFHYDCVASNWYNGYRKLYENNNKSFENFQSWLRTPMQTFGMCWP
ncbi:proteoglycan 4-like [Bicyclus anynana]|uniref:Proteoglycan 4-like n=1 Tax=Bicyclus anynana TaxID=110368 RepID=A0A6J1NHJ8_BICAN|nr:proteoglycan 4-like [Bicyclus anynana]